MNRQSLLLRFALPLALLCSGWGMSTATAETTYAATMKGIECNACKKTVAKALGGLPGVEMVRIQKRTENLHDLTVITDGSAPISKAEAIKALGKKAPHYEIITWAQGSA
ncbi:MAG: heavy metal-associated domain-containing protein [Verrucomicrobiota bacterium]